MFVEGGLHPEQIKALRQMSLQRRLDLALAGIAGAGALRKAMIRVEHPDWSTNQIEQALREEVRNAGK
jgi:DNA-binding transcriptional regulator WhiA